MFVTSAPKIGDRVRLTRNVEVMIGTFYKGTEFEIKSFGYRGPNLYSEEDQEWMIEAAFITPHLEIWRGEWVPYSRNF